MTTILDQYKAIKLKYSDAIILFRVGDYYEAFEGDAVSAANILGGLFMETKNEEGELKMFSIPHHSLDIALQKLVRAGHKVGICDQLEDPKTAKGPVKRGVTDLL